MTALRSFTQRTWRYLQVLVFALSLHGAAAETSAVYTPPAAGVSGPGKPLPDGWTYASSSSGRSGANGTAVTQGLLPPIRPLLDLHIRDTVICLGGDGNYYLTGSTGADIWTFNDGVELWRSPDLQKWEYLGLVWVTSRDGTWEKEPRDLHGKPTVTIWAPEIHYLKKLNTYAIVLSMAPGGISILKSITGKPEGPYTNPMHDGRPLKSGGIDATLFEDDDGKVYFTNGAGSTISLLKDDLSGFAETREIKLLNPDHNPAHHAEKIVKRGMNGFGHEGAVLFKANGKYYHGAVDDYEGRYSSCVAVADNIWGPYDQWHETVPTGGGTNFFQDKNGLWWCAYFGNEPHAPFREMPAIVRVEFGTDGKIGVASKQPDFVLLECARGGKSPWSSRGDGVNPNPNPNPNQNLIDDLRPVVDDSKAIVETAARSQLPTLFIVGDSTASSNAPLRGWGSEIGAFFDPAKINVVNRAIGGRSTRTYITDGRWDKILSELKPGDFVLVQFGHNDDGDYRDPKAKGRPSIRGESEETAEAVKADLKTVETIHSFGWYLRKYATDAKARGATVLLLSKVPHKD